jgi:hypothetical protein
LTESFSDIPEKGKSGKCSQCGGSYWIKRESFILRCYAVAGERYCSQCGEELEPSTYCSGCGALYPDYCVVYTKKPPQRAFEKKSFSLGLPFSRSTKKSTSLLNSPGKRGVRGSERQSDLRRQVLMVGGGIAFLAVIAFIVLFYMGSRAEDKFAREFVVALYGVKSGTDQCLTKSALLTGGSRLLDKDRQQLQSVKSEIDLSLQALSPPPKKFSDAHARLLKLSGTYEKLYALCLSSTPSAEMTTATETLEAQFYSQAKELQGSLPSELREELILKVPRYSNLQFMLE